MWSRFHLWGFALLCLCLFSPSVLAVQAAEEEAENISSPELVAAQEGFENIGRLFDGNTTRGLTVPDQSWLTVSHPLGIGSVYLIFDTEYGPYTVTNEDTRESHTFGENGFLHEFLDFKAVFGTIPHAVTIAFSDGDVQLNELYLFSPGEVPDFVQKWQPPKEGKTDLILFSTHGDDEQLFFAGLLPYYAGELDYEVLVAYLTNHRNCGTLRCHEMLNGLWAVGVTTYPVFGRFGDFYSRSKENAYEAHRKAGESDEALLGFVVKQLRRFHPQVVVGHDVNGEYGHGQHKMYADLLCRGLEAAEDPGQYPELAAQYGTWQVSKAYLHLWPENQITMDWDEPLDRFDGLTAFQVSQKLGFPCHRSQYGGFTWYIAGYDKAADIPKYNPCVFGLYRSAVGPDSGAPDFFENLTSYAQQELVAAIALIQENARQAKEAATAAALARQHRAEVQAEARRVQLQAEAAAREAERIRTTAFLLTVTSTVSIAAVFAVSAKRKQK